MKTVFLFFVLMISPLGLYAQEADSIIGRPASDTLSKLEEREWPIHYCDDPMQFPGGEEAMYAFLYETIVFKNENEIVHAGIQGRVVLRLLINNTGRIDSVVVARSAHPLLDSAAIEAVRKMPPWEPIGRYTKTFSFWYSLPINFELTPKKNE